LNPGDSTNPDTKSFFLLGSGLSELWDFSLNFARKFYGAGSSARYSAALPGLPQA
jgi:hypothetical protein